MAREKYAVLMSTGTATSSRPRDRGLRLLFGGLLVVSLVGALLAGGYAAWADHQDNGTGDFGGLGLALGLVFAAFWTVTALVAGTTLWAIRARTGRSTVMATVVATIYLVALAVTRPSLAAGAPLAIALWFVPVSSLVVVLVRWNAIRRERHVALRPQSSPR